MRSLLVTKHDGYIIVYADRYVFDESFNEVLYEIYIFEGEEKVMYAFFRGRTLIFSNQEKTTSNEMKLAGDFTRLQRPENPARCSLYKFDLTEDVLTMEMELDGIPVGKTVERFNNLLDMYFGDIWRICNVFDVIFI